MTNKSDIHKEIMPACPLCNSRNTETAYQNCKDYITEQQFELIQCQQCQIYITAGLEKARDKNFYGSEYYSSEKGKFSALLEKIFSSNHKRHARKFYNRFNPQTVLDIGCGRAYLLQELKKLGCQIQGLESEDAADWILNNKQVPVKASPQTGPWPLNDNDYDLVILWHVLEHLQNPQEIIRQAFLKPFHCLM